MILNLLDRNVPALHRVALCAVRPHSAIVNVRVAVLAIFPDIRENRLNVALRASHFFVHPAQGVTGLVVVKFGVRTNRFPGGSRMAILAGDGEGSMRTSSGLPLRWLRWSDGWQCEDTEPAEDLKEPTRTLPLGYYPRSANSSGREA